MSSDTVQFVDSIVSSPTVRLDMNDQTVYATANFDAPPPPIRRNIITNAMRSGAFVSSSLFDNRVLTISLELVGASQDASATAWQTLARELSRDRNIIKFQRVGATKPIFFKTYRSSATQIQEILAAVAFRTITVEVFCEPFAVGLQESGSATINNDPANVTNGCFFSFGSIVGDVATPLKMTLSHSTANFNGFLGLYGCTSTSYVSAPGYIGIYQLKLSEATTKPTITTGDALMSNGDYGRTTHALGVQQTDWVFNGTESVYTHGNTTVDAMEPGTYKLLVRVRCNTAANNYTLNVYQTAGSFSVADIGSTFDIALNQVRWVDAGTISVPYGAVPRQEDTAFTTYTVPSPYLTIKCTANQTASGSLDYDAFCFVPVNPSYDDRTTNQFIAAGDIGVGQTIKNLIVDADNEEVIYTDESVPKLVEASSPPGISGGFIHVNPSSTVNACHIFSTFVANGASDLLASTSTFAWSYYPRYLYVRPSAT